MRPTISDGGRRAGHILFMTSQAKPKPRTTLVPVTTMEELPVLDENERAELLRMLRQAKD